MPSGLTLDLQIELALEDALVYYGLIDSPRPEHPDFGESDEDKNSPCTSEPSDQRYSKLQKSTASRACSLQQMPFHNRLQAA